MYYTTLANLKARIGTTATTDDALLLRFIERASAMVRAYTGRSFVPVYAEYLYDVPNSRTLHLRRDLLEVALLEDASVRTSAEYLLISTPPTYYAIKMRTGAAFWTYSDDPEQAISVTGWWGYHENETAAWATVTTVAADVNAAATSITVNDAANITAYQYVRAGDELMLVTAVDTATDVLTVERGANGSVAEAHVIGDAVRRWNVLVDVQEATEALAQFMYDNRDKAGLQVVAGPDGTAPIAYASAETIVNGLSRYRVLNAWGV